ncbi:MAG TPA: hypothetical protein VF545_07295 [Thermoleophilaceae bacterium]|jgi:hypothetical protein
MQIAELVVCCADVGSIARGNFGWARRDPAAGAVEEHRGGEEIIGLATTVKDDLQRDRPVALGFECPLFVPVPEEPLALGRARKGDGNRAWSASPGTGALATGVVQAAWLLTDIANTVPSVHATFDWPTFSRAGHGLFLWEAFVTGAAKRDTHVNDARAAVDAFVDALPEPFERNALDETRVLSLIGAAAIWSGLARDIGLLGAPCLVLRAADPTG